MPNVSWKDFRLSKRLAVEGIWRYAVALDFSDANPPLMFTGIQLLSRSIRLHPARVFSHSYGLLPQAVTNGERVAVHVAGGRWMSFPQSERYRDISLRLLAGAARV